MTPTTTTLAIGAKMVSNRNHIGPLMPARPRRAARRLRRRRGDEQRSCHQRRRHELARPHVPVARAFHDRQRDRRRLVGHEPAVFEHRHRAGVGVDRDELHPAVDDQLGDFGLAAGHRQQRVGRRVDDDQQPHRLVDLHHLQRQAGAQVALVAVHHADEAGDVVRQLGAAAEDLVVDRGEVVLEADAGADRSDRGQDSLEHRVVGVGGGVVADQEGAAVEVEAAGERPPADDADGVGAVPVLRPHLRQVGRPRLDVGQRRLGRGVQRRVVEPPAALEGVLGARHLERRGTRRRTPPGTPPAPRRGRSSARCRRRCRAARRRTRCRRGSRCRVAPPRPARRAGWPCRRRAGRWRRRAGRRRRRSRGPTRAGC